MCWKRIRRRTLQDAADYEFGIVSPGGQETAQAIEDIEEELGKALGNGEDMKTLHPSWTD